MEGVNEKIINRARALKVLEKLEELEDLVWNYRLKTLAEIKEHAEAVIIDADRTLQIERIKNRHV